MRCKIFIRYARKNRLVNARCCLASLKSWYLTSLLLLILRRHCFSLHISSHGLFIFGRILVHRESLHILAEQLVLLIILDHYLALNDTCWSSLAPSVGSDVDEDDGLTNKHTNSACSKTAYYTKQCWNDKETQRLVDDMAHSVMSMVTMMTVVSMWVLTISMRMWVSPEAVTALALSTTCLFLDPSLNLSSLLLGSFHH